MGMDGSGLTVADALALQDRNNDGMFGGSGAWVFFLFFLLAWGNGGWGGWGNRGEQIATNAEVQRGFDNQNVMNKLNGIENGICDGFYAMNTTNLQGFHGVDNAVCSLGYQTAQLAAENRFAAQQCCCETNRNIDAVRYENARNTCDIVNAIKADGDATRALMTQNTIQDLRDRLQDAKFANSQCAQNAYLVDQLRPCARPAYITCSPYQTSYPYGFNGYNDGCGCGCGC